MSIFAKCPRWHISIYNPNTIFKQFYMIRFLVIYFVSIYG